MEFNFSVAVATLVYCS